jgi:hypothetical protein
MMRRAAAAQLILTAELVSPVIVQSPGMPKGTLPNTGECPTGTAIRIGAMTAGMMQLPLTAVLITTLFLGTDGITTMPVVIVAVVVSLVLSKWLAGRPPHGLLDRVSEANEHSRSCYDSRRRDSAQQIVSKYENYLRDTMADLAASIRRRLRQGLHLL